MLGERSRRAEVRSALVLSRENALVLSREEQVRGGLDDVSAWVSAPRRLSRGPAGAGRSRPRWQLGAGEGTVARLTAAGLPGWLTGRDRDVQIAAPHESLPAIPRWL